MIYIILKKNLLNYFKFIIIQSIIMIIKKYINIKIIYNLLIKDINNKAKKIKFHFKKINFKIKIFKIN